MLTILVMARMGRWTLLRVEDLLRDKTRWESCERCKERIRYVHVCQMDGEAKEWRIGSTCGPALIEVSKEIWGETAKDAKRNLTLLHRALRLKPLEQQATSWGSAKLGADWVDRAIAVLESGQTNERTLQMGIASIATDLQVIQRRLMLAERFHGLGPIRMGAGK